MTTGTSDRWNVLKGTATLMPYWDDKKRGIHRDRNRRLRSGGWLHVSTVTKI